MKTEGNRVIRLVTFSSGVVSTLAGLAGAIGSSDGVGAAARFDNPYAVDIVGSGAFALVVRGRSGVRGGRLAGGDQGGAGMPRRPAYFVCSCLCSAMQCTSCALVCVRHRCNSAMSCDCVNSAGLCGHRSCTYLHYKHPRVRSKRAQADFNAQVIRLVTIPGGIASTIAGTLYSCQYGDGTGPAAKFCQPAGIAISRPGSFALVVSVRRFWRLCLGQSYVAFRSPSTAPRSSGGLRWGRTP